MTNKRISSSSDVMEAMSPRETKQLMTGGFLGKIYAGYAFSNEDLFGFSGQSRIAHIKETILKSLLKKGELTEGDYQLMIINTLGNGYPEGSFPTCTALYAVVIVPRFPKWTVSDDSGIEIDNEISNC